MVAVLLFIALPFAQHILSPARIYQESSHGISLSLHSFTRFPVSGFSSPGHPQQAVSMVFADCLTDLPDIFNQYQVSWRFGILFSGLG